MKIRLYICLLVVFMSLYLQAQTERTFSLVYDEKEFNFSTIDELAFINSVFYNTILKEDTIAPALPYVCYNILIGPDESFLGATSEENDTLLYENITIAPNPENNSRNIDQLNIKKHNFKPYKDSFYPRTPVEYTGTHITNGYKFLTFLICPFYYDFSKKKLYLRNKIDLKLQIKSTTDLALQKKENQLQKYDKNSFQNFFLNEDQKDVLYSNTRFAQKSEEPYRYLIITTDSMKEAFEHLVYWKSTKGVRAKILTIEDIYSQDTVADRSNQLKIKYAIKEYYKPYHGGVKYVLLGGDDNIVPTQMCYIQSDFNHVTNHKMTPSDLFYSSFTNMSWDQNHNGISAELDDNISISPDVVVARLPAGKISEAKSMIDRIISYEKECNEYTWNNNMLLSGVKTSINYNLDGRPASDSEIQTDSMYARYILPKWNGNVFRFYDTYTDDFQNGSNYNVTATNLQREFSKGYSFSFINTHGNIGSWEMEAAPYYYYSTDASNLVNPFFSIITTVACSTNAFDSASPCLGESFMCNPNGGILAYYGFSRESIGSGRFGKDIMLLGTFYEDLFGSYFNILGDAVYESKKRFLADCNNYNSTRWMYLALNIFGDPEMCVYPIIPLQIPSAIINYNGSDLSVTTGLTRPYLCLMSKYDNGNSFYYIDTTNSSPLDSGTSFTNKSEEYILCLTKPGYLPTIANLGDTVHLQNENVIGKYNVIANHVVIGNNVTDKTSHGNIVIESGKTAITCHDDVMIEGGFEVKQGAEFEIEITDNNTVVL